MALQMCDFVTGFELGENVVRRISNYHVEATVVPIVKREKNVRVGQLPVEWLQAFVLETLYRPLIPFRVQQRFKLPPFPDGAHQVRVLLSSNEAALQTF